MPDVTQSLMQLGRAAVLVAAGTGAGFVGAAEFIYTVQPGDNPWNVATRYLNNPALALRLSALNNIPNDRKVPPGTQLRIPSEWLRIESTQVRVLATAGDTLLTQGAVAVRAAVAGERLQAPAGLRTGATGSATLLFADGSRVLVRRDTELQLLTSDRRVLGGASLIELMLVSGSLENAVTPQGQTGGRFDIKTPAAVAAVRGTDFRVRFDANNLRTEVLEGAVEVANPSGKVTARAAQGSLAQAGQLPGAPVALLGAPGLEVLPAVIERLPINWPVLPVPGATSYRTQMSSDTRFTSLASDETTDAPRIRAVDVPDGVYTLRVRAIDAVGLEGVSAQRAIEVHARPEPPLLIEPAPGAIVTSAAPLLRWTDSAGAARYRVQLMRPGNPVPVQDQTLPASAPLPAELAPGLYQWRVAGVDAVKGQGPWGDVQGFRRVLPGPGVGAEAAADGSLTLRWSAQPQTASYRLQVAKDSAFDALVSDTQTRDTQAALKDLQPGSYFVRVHAVGDDGFVGPWGGSQTFTVAPPVAHDFPAWWLLLIPLLGLF